MHPSSLDDILQQVAEALVAELPPRWQAATYTYCAAGALGRETYKAMFSDGSVRDVDCSMEATNMVDDLRAAMYAPDKGPWYTATFTITADLAISADFDYDHEPLWGWAPPAPEIYLADLKAFPRPSSAIPEWLRARVAETGLPLPTTDDPHSGPSDHEVALASLRRAITEELLMEAPPGWEQVSCTLSEAGPITEALTTATCADGRQYEIRGLTDLYQRLHTLREVMHDADPDAPLWFTVTATVHRDQDLRLTFDTEGEPDWGEPVTPQDYAEDLRRYPRPAHAVPAWLTERLAQDGA